MEPTETPMPEPVTPTISAERDAANRGDFTALDEAALAQRRGTPLPRVEAPEPPETTAPTGQPALTAKQLKEQKADERLRQRVAEAVAEKDAEIARLRARVQWEPRTEQGVSGPGGRSEAPPPQTPPTVPEWKRTAARIAALPDAPKLEDFDSVDLHSAAMHVFVDQHLQTERQAADQQRAEADALTTAQQARVDAFVTQLRTAAADPTFVAALSDEVKALTPFAGLTPGEVGGPRNVIAEQIYDSPIAPAVLRHLSQHPEVLRRLETMPAAIAALPPAGQVRAHMQWIVREYGKLEAQLESSAAPPEPAPAARSTITAAPPPPPTLTRAGSTSDPTASALKRDDFSAFDRIEMEKARAKRLRA